MQQRPKQQVQPQSKPTLAASSAPVPTLAPSLAVSSLPKDNALDQQLQHNLESLPSPMAAVAATMELPAVAEKLMGEEGQETSQAQPAE